jgi:hypothetical protein
MTEKHIPNPERRVVIRGCFAMLATAPVLLRAAKARADAPKLQKTQVQYVEKGTVEGRDCDDCVHFIAGKTREGAGTCRIVEGAISPHGHCAAFTALRR